MTSLDILCSGFLNFSDEITKKLKLEKTIRKCFVTHQNWLKIFHGPPLPSDMIRAERFLRDTMDTTSELSKLIKKSTKREAVLSKLKEELSLRNYEFRVLCPTLWTVRAESLTSVLDN